MEPALDERGDEPGLKHGRRVHHAAMEPALDERGDLRGGTRKLYPDLAAAMEPALDERGDS